MAVDISSTNILIIYMRRIGRKPLRSVTKALMQLHLGELFQTMFNARFMYLILEFDTAYRLQNIKSGLKLIDKYVN